MLHAFYAGTSPSDPQRRQGSLGDHPEHACCRSLYKLADDNYKNDHQLLRRRHADRRRRLRRDVEHWKTILVGGLNDGGKGYYALDVTDPATPKGCGSSTGAAPSARQPSEPSATADCHLGYTFGKPLITKLADGTWVVMVTSGYNNVNGAAGDGKATCTC